MRYDKIKLGALLKVMPKNSEIEIFYGGTNTAYTKVYIASNIPAQLKRAYVDYFAYGIADIDGKSRFIADVYDVLPNKKTSNKVAGERRD